MSDLPVGAKIPITFKQGQPLTANELNEMQKAMMLLLLTHNHTGNEQAAPQGVVIGSSGIAPNAIKGPHISPNAVNKGDIHNGAVGASEIAEKCIGSNHLVNGAVGTPQIKDKSVTMAKLADEILALLNTPREGATTYAYCTYMDGLIAYPTETGRWFDWLLDAKAPVRLHDLPIRRLRDDGGWQPIRSILPPDAIRQIQPNLDMTTRAEMATSLAGIFKQNEAVLRDVLGGPVAEVQSEGTRWSVTLSTGEKRFLADTEMRGLLDHLGTVGGDLSRMSAPLRTSSGLNLIAAFDRLAPVAYQPGATGSGATGSGTSVAGATGSGATGSGATGSGASVLGTTVPGATVPGAAVPGAGMALPGLAVPISRELAYAPIMKLPFDPALFLNPTPSDDLQERTRVGMLVDPRAIGWQVAQEGTSFFQPGIGGNAVFTETGERLTFTPGEKPSKEELVVLGRMLYHFDIEDDQRLDPEYLLSIPKFYDFLNNPHLLAAGYWTGAARNIRAVVRMRRGLNYFVRVRFATPYNNASYVVSVTPDYKAEGEIFAPITAHVLSRRADYVDLLFLRADEPINKLNFSLAIHGELIES